MKNTFAFLLLLGPFVTPTKAATTVVNGSFEDLDASYVNAPGWDHMVDAAGTAWTKFNSPDWMLSDGPENLYNTPHAQHFALGGATGTFASGVYREGVSQVVSGFTVGETYEVSFSHANGLRYNAQTLLHEGVGTIGGWQVLVDSASLGLFASINDNSVPTLAWTSDWQSSSVSFTATNTSHNLRFIAYTPDGPSDPTFQFLDHVDVQLVPEPSSTALLGFGGLALILRRRR